MVRTRSTVAKDEGQKSTEKKVMFSYNTLMTRYPMLMNEAQSGIISASAVACSNIISAEEVDHWEISVMVIVTLTFITPIITSYYSRLGKMNLPLLQSIVLDQLIFSPVFTTGIIMYRAIVLDVLSGSILPSGLLDVGDIGRRAGQVIPIIPSIMMKSWGYWIPIRLLILKFVPPMYHVVIGSACSFVWQIIMAMALKEKK